ncbi:MAG TPA: PQQ-binding-like beta-propeller repeat protein [Dehalococcoidales bacterium]
MSSAPDARVKSASSEIQHELWLICPICKQPNQAGTLHCKHCWGASLYAVTPVTNEQLAEFVQKRNKRLNRLRLLRNLVIGIGAPLLLVSMALYWVYAFTDLLFTPPAYLNSTSLQGDWTMFRHDPSRTGATDIIDTNPRGELKWSFQTGGEISSSPTVVNGIVYFGSRDFKLYALDIDTGQKQWEFATESWVESSPVVANGIVYFGSNDGKLYALDALTGHKLWDFQTKYVVKSTPAVAGDTVYFGGDDYFIYALDAKTGEKKWDFKTESYVMSSPVIYDGILYVGSMDSSCYALNAEDGRFRLRLKTREEEHLPFEVNGKMIYYPTRRYIFTEVTSAPSVSGDIVYFTSGSHLYAMDGKARNWPREEDLRPWWIEFWAFGMAPPPPPVSGFEWKMKLTYTSSNTTPVIDETTLYTTGDSRVLRIDLTTKEFDWTFRTGGTIRSSPALANGVLYVGSNDGRLYAINAQDGNPLWNFQTDGKITSSPTYANGVIYVTSWDGKLYAIE